jgi:hypothetical protein
MMNLGGGYRFGIAIESSADRYGSVTDLFYSRQPPRVVAGFQSFSQSAPNRAHLVFSLCGFLSVLPASAFAAFNPTSSSSPVIHTGLARVRISAVSGRPTASLNRLVDKVLLLVAVFCFQLPNRLLKLDVFNPLVWNSCKFACNNAPLRGCFRVQ